MYLITFFNVFCNENQAEWGPLRHVRVIKERNSGVSRGFAFIDFPSVVSVICNFSILCFNLDRLTTITVIVLNRKQHVQ